jgi:hypothetical protein
MNRSVLAFAFLAVLVALAPSVHAQATGSDCSTADQPPKTWNQQPPDAPGTAPNCNSTYQQSFTVYSTTVDTCTNQNTNTVYDQGIRQTTGIGYWSAPTSGAPFCSNSTTLKCNPNITQQVTHATSAADYNRFYLRAWDDSGAGIPPCTTVPVMSRQDFWQCKGVACPINRCTCRDCGCGSPIIIDLNGKGFALTDWKQGVMFDIFGDGNPVQMGWTAPGADNAFLALPGADGLVHGSRQLFGNFTPQPTSATPNGFAALAVYDDPKNGGNGDGVIDAKDAVFASLRLWIDVNHDGISQPDELHTLPSLGVNSIGLKYKEDDRTDQWGNVFRYRAQVNPGDATSTGRLAYDVFFVAELPPTTKNIPAKCQVPDKKAGMLAVKPAALR